MDKTIPSTDIEMQSSENNAIVTSSNGGSEISESDENAKSYRKNKGMESSVFRFHNVNFVVGKDEKEKHILQDVSGKVKYGRK